MLIVDQSVLDDIGRGFSVPAQPKLLLELLTLMAEASPDINAISRAISKDIAVSATILKTINSPLYGLGRTITDIKMSVNYIGIFGVVRLVTGSLLKKSFDPKNCSINLEDFWQKTSDIANMAMLLGQRYKPDIANDRFFSLGLFHACGVPVMAMKYSDYQQVLDNALTTPELALTEVEEKHYGVNHATIGYYVASSWRLPKDVCQIILQHRDRHFINKLNGSHEQDLFAVLKLSEQIVSIKHSDCSSADWSYVQENVCKILAIDEETLQNLVLEFTKSKKEE
ncbi:HDOD domain-containing protein [Colwellia psychrerythraea]|uniref:Putative signal transduction protein n=1 Tax=Colwellia psychrerythraea TaxID=28229 RepID=A0A099KF50_COLPS|nr:HDOD domain-containing protein [Colwellia psychrerythraea]KGJ88930.1 putative signal transduction protein [Colwellia psychrerythraea]